jgi:hypothetical protein
LQSGDSALLYHITVLDRLQEKWADWLNGRIVRIEPADEGENRTLIIVLVPDQAALRGILNRLWDLNLTLISVSLQNKKMK